MREIYKSSELNDKEMSSKDKKKIKYFFWKNISGFKMFEVG